MAHGHVAVFGVSPPLVLVPHDSETSDELAKHVRICDAEIWAKSQFANRDLAANDGLTEQDKAEIDSRQT